MMKPVILWLKRDLRLSDNEAMALSEKSGPVITICVIEPEIWTGNDSSKRHLYFYLDALLEINKYLLNLSVPLYIIESEIVNALEKIYKQVGNFNLVSHQETGNWLSFKRDEKVLKWCKKHKINWLQPRQNNVIRNLESRDLWTKHWNIFMNKSCLAKPKFIINKKIKLPQLNDFFKKIINQSAYEILSGLKISTQMYTVPKISFANSPRIHAEQLIESFLYIRSQNYQKEMSSPLTSQNSCSRLSPFLSWGVISIRELFWKLNQAIEYWKNKDNLQSKHMIRNLKSYKKRLHWRCHFIQKLECEPEIEFNCMHPAMNSLRTNNFNSAEFNYRFNAWKNAETGIDFVDACMNSLYETGWLNFRMRAMLMSFASYNLWLHWKKTGEYLAQLFLDYEPGIHWPQVQMQSGTSGINTIRIYNPKKQQADHDPKLYFTEKWVKKRIMENEIVCISKTMVEAKKKIWEIKKCNTYKDISKKIYKKHGSRLHNRRIKTAENCNVSKTSCRDSNLDLFKE
tara:strand:- start:40 stop:1578 length:1539 start_codon:yes stop_codon:yes gene_type:complete